MKVRHELIQWGLRKSSREVQENIMVVSRNIGALVRDPDNEPLRRITVQNIDRLERLVKSDHS